MQKRYDMQAACAAFAGSEPVGPPAPAASVAAAQSPWLWAEAEFLAEERLRRALGIPAPDAREEASRNCRGTVTQRS